MNILIMDRRDTRHPLAGGAEIMTLEVARRWVAAGHAVTWFSASFPRSARKDVIDGIRVVRAGGRYGFWFVQVLAALFYLISRGRYDLVVDQAHGLPFFTALYSKKRKVLVIYETGLNSWLVNYPRPLALLGWRLQRTILQLYKNVHIVTISESTKQALVALSVREHDIHIAYPGISIRPTCKLPEKAAHNVIFVGRLNSDKQVDHVIAALPLVREAVPDAQLWIVGKGPPRYLDWLHTEAVRYGVQEAVTFFGYVSEEQKIELLSRARVLASASLLEGWGLVVMEGSAVGTPAVVYDVPGYRNSVVDGKTGLLTRENTPRGLADGIIRLLTDEAMFGELQRQGWRRSKQFNWDRTAAQVLAAAAR